MQTITIIGSGISSQVLILNILKNSTKVKLYVVSENEVYPDIKNDYSSIYPDDKEHYNNWQRNQPFLKRIQLSKALYEEYLHEEWQNVINACSNRVEIIKAKLNDLIASSEKILLHLDNHMVLSTDKIVIAAEKSNLTLKAWDLAMERHLVKDTKFILPDACVLDEKGLPSTRVFALNNHSVKGHHSPQINSQCYLLANIICKAKQEATALV